VVRMSRCEFEETRRILFARLENIIEMLGKRKKRKRKERVVPIEG
jgi:hypothetical protein